MDRNLLNILIFYCFNAHIYRNKDKDIFFDWVVRISLKHENLKRLYA